METFSQRKGLKPVRSIMQVRSMDDDLRNRLWNAMSVFYWDNVKQGDYRQEQLSFTSNQPVKVLLAIAWHNYFKKPLDTLDDFGGRTYQEVRTYFFGCKWNEVYDFVEFVANNYEDTSENKHFMDSCNEILKEEMSAYRFVGGEIAQITSEEEIAEVETALKVSGSVANHLNTSLSLLSDKKTPDYRNSTKEAISAVEAMCQLITGDDKATLSQALKQIQKDGNVKLHPALEGAFSKLYGYTSNADGIRHAQGLLDEPNLDMEDAIFMLVSCSAFINYLKVKASKAGLKL